MKTFIIIVLFLALVWQHIMLKKYSDLVNDYLSELRVTFKQVELCERKLEIKDMIYGK